jgi:hypothetical protein
VLSPELELADLDARHWTNWWRLLVPPRVLARPAWALAILDDGVPGKVVVAGRGAVPGTGSPRLDTDGLAAWARELDVAAIVAIERGRIAELAGEIEGALGPAQDLVEQGLIVLRALKRHAGRGLWTEPPLLELLPAPAYDPLQRTFDLLVPDRSALVGYVLEDDRRRVHASILAVKERGDITRVATHRAIADLVPEASLARDWTSGYRRVIDATTERFARPSLAVFLERATLQRILTGPADQLARELNAKRVVIDPAPTWLLGLLGGATMAAMAGRAASAIASILPPGTRDRASALAGRARDAMKDSGAHPFALLGFDPLELWARLRHFYRA